MIFYVFEKLCVFLDFWTFEILPDFLRISRAFTIFLGDLWLFTLFELPKFLKFYELLPDFRIYYRIFQKNEFYKIFQKIYELLQVFSKNVSFN